jgi:hypothetical protein
MYVTKVDKSIQQARGGFYFPDRQHIHVGPDQLRVKLSPEDSELTKLHWHLHPKGYAFRRTWTRKNKIHKHASVTWLQHEVVRRMLLERGETPPAKIRITFKNGARLDCRRENLVLR